MATNEFGVEDIPEREFGIEDVPAQPAGGETAPIQAAQTSISQALNKPSSGPGLLSRATMAGIQGLADIGSGAVSGIPFGLGPSIVGMLPGTSTEDVEQDIAEAKKRSPVLFGAGEFGAELPAFLTGAGAGEKLVTKAGPVLSRLTPGLRKAGEYLLKGAGLGGVTGTEAAGRALVEGKPVGEALATGAETGLSMAALPGTFAAGPEIAGALGAGPKVRGLVSAVAPTALAIKSAPFEGDPTGLTSNRFENKGDATDWTKWLLTQGTMAGGAMGLEGGPGKAFERLATTSKESIQPKLRRATAEGMELARGDIYKDVRADETVRNQQFRAALKGEQRAMTAAEKIKQGDLTEIDKLANDTLDLDALVKGLGDGTDPSLRGLLGKLFQDVSNRLLRAKQALQNRPELANQKLVEKINTVDRLIEESYLKNTEKGGYLEDFNDDPYTRLEVERQSRLKRATEQRDAVAARQAKLLSRVASRNYLEEARAQRRPPTVPEDVARQLAEKAGLEYTGPDEQFGKPVRHSVKLSPEKQTELEAQTQAEFERQVQSGGRLLQGRAPEAEYGEKPPFFDPMNPMRSTAVIAPKLPDWVKPAVAGKVAAGVFRGTAKAPQSKFTEVQEATNPLRPSQGTLERPYNAVAMLRAWDRVLEAPSDATRGVVARIADRLGITPDKLMRTTAYRAAALEQALKDPDVAKEVMANVQAP